MQFTIDDTRLTITLPARIDTSSAAVVGKELTEICQNNPHEAVVLDASNLTYLSSSGFRDILSLLNEEHILSVTNVSSIVYNVFEMTGFTRIMHIEKALRRVELKEENLLGKGVVGAVYMLGADKIVKVNFTSATREFLQQELDASREAFVSGVPTAICYDVVDCGNGNLGTVYEAIHSDTLGSYMKKNPDKLQPMLDKYVELLKKLHTNHSAPAHLPRQRDVMIQRLESYRGGLFTDHQIDVLHTLLESMPDSDALIHGDCHPNNVMIRLGDETRDDELLFIDIADIAVGHPMVDFLKFFIVSENRGTNITDERAEEVTGSPRDWRMLQLRETFKKYFHYDDIQQEKLESTLSFLFPLSRLVITKIRVREKEVEFMKSRIASMVEELDNGRMESLLAEINRWAEAFPE